MASHIEIPIQSSAQKPKPVVPAGPAHKHRTRYYAHRVKESLTTRLFKLICSCFLGIIFILGLVAFILWLSLRPHRPKFHVTSFTVPGITPQNNGFQNVVITFNVTARNPNQNVDIYYDQMDGTIYYADQLIGFTPLLFWLHQPHKNTTEINGGLSGASLAVTDDSWNQFMAAGTVVFRLELTSGIRFKVASWTSRRHRMHADCDVGVGPDGQIVATYIDRRCSIYFD